MQMLVTPMRREGIALNPDERRRYRAIKADVRVRAEIDPELGSSTTVARLLGVMPLDPEHLPQLRDASLSSMAPTGFVLSGIEYIDGCAYAQSWWCREV
ncbi:hypothetical protein [Pseudomonas sp. PH1b]|uniref:hypothetical protein n=1 Tax=Pseudomonas sp. PH1b TaxID=1397282 RepID=UPI0004688992|nr:hypothetical protein [Pseudomonas sp. PH1b]